MNKTALIELAKKAMQNSYSPYSKFKVGAALLCSDESVYIGCNVENSSFGGTNCAERTAIFSAIADGKRNFEMMAVVGSSNGCVESFTPPCGICRQVMSEFCNENFEVILTNGNEIKSLTIEELLPLPFQSFK